MKIFCSIPPLQSAINLDGQGDGARIKIDVPRSEIERVGIQAIFALMGNTFCISDEYENINE